MDKKSKITYNVFGSRTYTFFLIPSFCASSKKYKAAFISGGSALLQAPIAFVYVTLVGFTEYILLRRDVRI